MLSYNEIKIPECKNFSGYKPCKPYKNCLINGCTDENENTSIGIKILIISLDALGNVMDNTPLLPAIKRKYPISTIHWITMPAAEKILFNNLLIDKLFVWNDEQRMIIKNIEYDVLMNADKSDYACAFANEVNAKTKLGFLMNKNGQIIPANQSAMYSYVLGNDDNLKFRENQRTGIEILHETFELEYKHDEYIYSFTEEENQFISNYKKVINYNPEKIYVGFNTGCSNLFPNKKMTVEQHIFLIKELVKNKELIIVLLGGREDTERNNAIYHSLSENEKVRVVSTPTTEGIRRGACYMQLSDIIITGDSFGMHLAIGLKKYVIAWFGLSCWTEIELYGRGEKLYPNNLECAPCWKKKCPYNLECISSIDLNKIINLVNTYSK